MLFGDLDVADVSGLIAAAVTVGKSIRVTVHVFEVAEKVPCASSNRNSSSVAYYSSRYP